MRALFIILSDEVVHEERLSASRWSEHELVAVSCHAFPHRQVGDVNVHGLPLMRSAILMPNGEGESI